MVRLGDYISLKTGKLDVNASSDDGRYPFFTCATKIYRIDNWAYDCECVLIAGNGDLNVKYYDGKFNAYQRTYILESKDKRQLDVRYLFHFMNKYIETLREGSIGGVIKYIKKGDIEEADIPLVSIEDQRRIADILDKADEIEKQESMAQVLRKEIIWSIFYDMFGDPVINPKRWETKQLGEILEITSSKRIFKNEYVSEGVPFYRTKEIVELSKGNVISSNLFITNDRYKEIKSKFDLPNIGDILLSAVGTIGVMWTVDHDNPFYFKDGNLVWLKSSSLSNVNSTYLRMTLQCLIANEKSKLAEGAAYTALTIAKLKKFDVVLAPFELQNKFASILEFFGKIPTTQHLVEKNSLSITQELLS